MEEVTVGVEAGQTQAEGGAEKRAKAGETDAFAFARLVAELAKKGRPMRAKKVLRFLHDPGVFEIIAKLREAGWTWPEVTEVMNEAAMLLKKGGGKGDRALKETSVRKEWSQMLKERQAAERERQERIAARRAAIAPVSTPDNRVMTSTARLVAQRNLALGLGS